MDLSETASHAYNIFKICVNNVKILSNRFETDFELDIVMRKRQTVQSKQSAFQLNAMEDACKGFLKL